MTINKRVIGRLLAAATLCLAQRVGAQERVVNGTFDQMGAGWDAGVIGDGSVSFGNSFFSRNGNMAGMGGTPFTVYGLDQEVGTVAGQQYTFSFWLRHVSTVLLTEDAKFRVQVGNQLFVEERLDRSLTAWTLYQFAYLAISDVTTVSFTAYAPSSRYLIDDVSLIGPAPVPVPTPPNSPTPPPTTTVPEPSSVILLGAGIVALTLVHRRRLSSGVSGESRTT